MPSGNPHAIGSWGILRSAVFGVLLTLFCYNAIEAQGSWDDLDRGRLLVSTFMGGSGMEGVDGIPNIDMARDPLGNVIVVGLTNSTDFPASPGAIQETVAGEQDLFVAKFSSDLKRLLAATLLGGDQVEQCPRVCVDGSGNIYVAGATSSAGFPGSTAGYDDELSGDWDIFVSKLDNSLTTLSASTYVGGDGGESFGFDLVLDQSGNVFVAGYTDGSNFTVVPGSYDTSYNGGTSDIFVAKFDQSLASLTASTYVGGSLQDEGTVNVAVDGEGNLVLFGTTGSDDYPRTATAYDTSFNGPDTAGPHDLDLCVTKLSNDLTTLVASTFVGGSEFERAYRIALDGEGNVFLTGHTASTDYPVTPGAFDEGHNGDDETFVTKLSGDLTQMLGSTYFTPNDEGGGFFIGMEADSEGNLWLAGGSGASDYPVTDNAYAPSYNGGVHDAILVKLSADCDTVFYATFFGGDARDLDAAIVPGDGGDYYLAGYTLSSNLPVIGGYDSSYAGGQDAYVAKFTNSMFTRMTEGPHVSPDGTVMGASWVDYDNDGYPDLFVPVYDGPNGFYRNEGDGSFTEPVGCIVSEDDGSNAGCWADFDNDSDADGYVANGLHEPVLNYYYINDGDGTFTKVTGDISVLDAAGSIAAVCADYDDDGVLDLFVPSSVFGGASNDYLYKGLGDGSFVKVTEGPVVEDEVQSGPSCWTDIDDDGDPDLLVSKGGGATSDILYRNDSGVFTPLSGIDYLMEPNGQDFTFGDFDNDGDRDLFIPTWNGNNSALYENLGGGSFSEVTGQPILSDGHWSTASCAADFDNDGDLDIFLVNDNNSEARPDYFYVNDGTGYFSSYVDSVAVDWPGDFSCKVAPADYDRDGDIDLYVVNWYADEPNLLYRNNGNDNGWIVIRPEGILSNQSAIGCKVRVLANIGGSPVWQMREIRSHTSTRGQSPFEAHFGLGDATLVDSVVIEWPSGYEDVLTGVSVNQFMDVLEGETIDIDGDGTVGYYDNCPKTYNPLQEDTDGNGVGDACCCGQYTMGYTGNVNCSDDGKRTLSDVSRLIDRLYISKTILCCESNANTNGSEDRKLTLSDISVLIDHLYISKAETAECSPSSAPVLNIPYGTPVTVDGVLEAGEWADAAEIEYEVEGYVQVTTLIKHDGANLLLAYYYQYYSDENWCFPELMLDVGNNKRGEWESDDYWFHVSGTDCEGVGAPDVYDDCSVEQPDWGGVPNFSLGPDPPPLDTFEVWISFPKLGVTAGDEIGVALRVEWVPYIYGFWPVDAAASVPASWSNGVLEP